MGGGYAAKVLRRRGACSGNRSIESVCGCSGAVPSPFPAVRHSSSYRISPHPVVFASGRVVNASAPRVSSRTVSTRMQRRRGEHDRVPACSRTARLDPQVAEVDCTHRDGACLLEPRKSSSVAAISPRPQPLREGPIPSSTSSSSADMSLAPPSVMPPDGLHDSPLEDRTREHP